MIDLETIDEVWPTLTKEQKDEVFKHALAIEAQKSEWKPLPGPQTEAYFCEADHLFYGGSAGSGKKLAIDTPIPTIDGWTTMESITSNDVIFDEKGNQCKVTLVQPITKDITYKLKFSDGSEIIACKDHLWITETYKDRLRTRMLSPEWRAARRAKRPSRSKGKRPDLALRNSKKQHNYLDLPIPTVKSTEEIAQTLVDEKHVNHSIPVCKALVLPHKELPIDPYVLGAWLGDGSRHHQGFTCADTELLEHIEECGFKISKRSQKYEYGILGLQKLLRLNGLINNKHVPSGYLRASIEQRLALLQGLMDTDGCCGVDGACEFTTAKEILAKNVHELLGTLGIKATIGVGIATLYGKDCGPKYRIQFLSEYPAFKLKRKLERQKLSGFRGTHNRRYIVSCDLIDPVEMRCIAVDSPSHLYLAGRNFIATHNTDLVLGLAHKEHQRSIIYRREYGQLKGIIERGRELFDQKDKGRYNQQRNCWRLNDGRLIELGACQHVGDEQKHQGVPHDFVGFDEITHFTYYQFIFLCGWLRSTTPGQRKRIICAGNPPTDAAGDWVIKYWAAWLDDHHPNPAKPGELRWYTTLNGEEVECPNGEPFTHNKELIRPESRTFIPGTVDDNPYLLDSGYKARLQALPEPLRSKMLLGDFSAGREDDAWQVIPTAWVRLAQDRWRNTHKPQVPMSAIGVDVARGGADKTVLTFRYANWFDKQLSYPGSSTPDGDAVAGLVFKSRINDCAVIIDVIGVGSAVYDAVRRQLSQQEKPKVLGFNAAAGSDSTDKSKQLTFINQRAEWYWRLREALDPSTGEGLCLPDDRELLTDLCAARWQLTASGIKVEPKDDIIKRIGRSPDKGDSLVYAFVINTRRPPRMTDMNIMGR